MSFKDQVYKEISSAKDFISGQSLAKKYSKSRMAVNNAIEALRQEGNEILAVNRLGYKLINQADSLNIDKVYDLLHCKEFYDIQLLETIDSTNLYLKSIEQGQKEGKLVIAKEQKSGRGRLDRKFHSPKNSGIYMSLLLRPNCDNKYTSMLTALAAVAVNQAIKSVFDLDSKIKWVNDIYLNDRKVCGILTQAAFDMENNKLDYVIVGIGINVYVPVCGFPEDIKNIAGAILQKHIPNKLNELVASILNNIYTYYTNIENLDFVKLYKQDDYLLNKYITVHKPQNSYNAMAQGIDDNCHLIVKYEDGSLEHLNTGEVSIRLRS